VRRGYVGSLELISPSRFSSSTPRTWNIRRGSVGEIAWAVFRRITGNYSRSRGRLYRAAVWNYRATLSRGTEESIGGIYNDAFACSRDASSSFVVVVLVAVVVFVVAEEAEIHHVSGAEKASSPSLRLKKLNFAASTQVSHRNRPIFSDKRGFLRTRASRRRS